MYLRVQDIVTFMYKVKLRLLPSSIHSVAVHLGTTSVGTQIFISPDSILSTMANTPYDISDHICGQNLDRQVSQMSTLTLTSFVSSIHRKNLANLISNYVCTGNAIRILDISIVCTDIVVCVEINYYILACTYLKIQMEI